MYDFIIQVANAMHLSYAEEICNEIADSAQKRGTGIARRSPGYIEKKILENKAVIATTKQGEFAGFCYIETWSNGEYLANSGLIVNPKFREHGLAKKIKERAFKHSRKMYPKAKLFGLTTSLAVMKINSDIGYHPVTFQKLTNDQEFWKGCSSCVNYHILTSKGQANCLCTGMLYDPEEKQRKKWNFITKSRLWERFMRIKKSTLLTKIKVL
ncbi:MAG: GNAT family N-acetyltransferase [Cyclobacteriaceae bacterium]